MFRLFQIALLLGLLSGDICTLSAAEARFTAVFEGVGKIKAGNTVKARRLAVEDVMKKAMQSAILRAISTERYEQFANMIESQLVARYNNFVSSYRVERESTEGTIYRLRARVLLDANRLSDELRSHGLVTNALKRPKVVAFIVDRLGGEAGMQRVWWQDKGDLQKAAGQGQAILRRRSRGLGMDFVSKQQLLRQTSGAEPFEELSRQTKPFHLDLLMQLADSAGADYLVFGTVDDGFLACDLSIYNMANRKQLSRYRFTKPSSAKEPSVAEQENVDVVTYQTTGLVLQDWLNRWLGDQRITLQFLQVKSLAQYQRLLKELRKLEGVKEVQEELFALTAVHVNVKSSLRGPELLKRLKRQAYFRRKSEVALKNERTIEVTFK